VRQVPEGVNRVSDRLSPLDVSFLYMEESTTAMHVGGVAIFRVPDDGFDYERLVSLISSRIAFVPRYRQRIRNVPGRLANPVWVDDEHFDVTFHVRRSALPRPGTDDQLHELVARLMSRSLDRNRPLWEIYLVEGLSDDRFAVITKTHHALVDGISAIDIGQIMLDVEPTPRPTPPDSWRPHPEPSWFELVAGAISDGIRRPTEVLETLLTGANDLRQTSERVLGAAVGLLSAASVVVQPAPSSPLNVSITSQRRFATARTDLDDYKRIRKFHGGTVNDVVLATVAGALRSWLLARSEVLAPGATVRAMVPVSVRRTAHGGEGAVGNAIASYVVDLPVGEVDAVMRLSQVSHAMRAVKEAYQAVGAEALVRIGGFAPPTLHSLGARVVSRMSKRVFNVLVTNVPGPQFPLYAAGALMLEAYPVVPLAKGQAVAIGCTSYNGSLTFGLNGDRDAMKDVNMLASCLEESLQELVETVR
jgi:diacylglycerol O-acyltransferase / wax synthase